LAMVGGTVEHDSGRIIRGNAILPIRKGINFATEKPNPAPEKRKTAAWAARGKAAGKERRPLREKRIGWAEKRRASEERKTPPPPNTPTPPPPPKKPPPKPRKAEKKKATRVRNGVESRRGRKEVF